MKPLVHIGWILAVDVRSANILDAHEMACRRLQETLAAQFPQFRWRVQFLHRYRYAPRGTVDPLLLLEYGVQEKIVQRWDYVLVAVTNALHSRQKVHTVGVPSSALETAVISSAELGAYHQLGERMAGLALHLLGHVWGLEHDESGPMSLPENPEQIQISLFPEEQQLIAVDRLEEVADRRLEEQSQGWSLLTFYWRAFWADPKSILIDVVGYAPWSLPLQMGRLTAATAVSLVFLLLAAEAWEVGVNLPVSGQLVGSVLAVLMATGFVFYGQNLGQFSREVGWREQLARTRIVIFGTLFLGMAALWVVLFAVSFFAGLLLPEPVLAGWVRQPTITSMALIRHAAFMATFGVVAGALGGNLEDEDEIKATLLYDEET
jgi:hypothetical protein